MILIKIDSLAWATAIDEPVLAELTAIGYCLVYV